MGRLLPVPGQRLSALWCSLSKKTTNRSKMERPPPRQAVAPREQPATVPGQKALSPLARTGPVRWTGALAPTRVVTPPLEWILVLAQREQVRGRLLRRGAGVFRGFRGGFLEVVTL